MCETQRQHIFKFVTVWIAVVFRIIDSLPAVICFLHVVIYALLFAIRLNLCSTILQCKVVPQAKFDLCNNAVI